MHLSVALAAAGLSIFSTTVSGHMILNTPTPFGKSTLNSSPLAADGSDFPCKQRGSSTYDATGVSNTMPIGATQTLSFIGSAVHGGGSCQVSLTTDKNPTAQSKWMVIHSIIGGCPSNTTDGNLTPEDPNGTGANKYTYSIPQGIQPGQYTLAWTWFNRVGNREMYMNCAPVTVTGSAPAAKRGIETRKAVSRSSFGWFNRRSTFPDMFKANIGSVSGSCATVSDTDPIFPDPGDSVEYDRSGPSDPSAKPPTGCSSPTVAAGGSATATAAAGSGPAAASAAAPTVAISSAAALSASRTVSAAVSQAASGTASMATSAAASVATTAATTAALTAAPTESSSADECMPTGGASSAAAPEPAVVTAGSSAAAASPTAVTATGAPSVAPIAVSSDSPSAAASVAPAAPSGSSSSDTTGSTGSSGSTGGLTGACTTEGMWNCIGGTSFQRCASGAWSAVQPMAGGTTCQTGQSESLAMI
ncbi:MAG: hypothetical protein LQ340_001891 [Diploschistes diacapsis]|nr:MAG: hypothetical protein LQ340_001891 [Diploschistes diacapsis]